ncbi:hypothetical protein ABAC460_20830 [Asticcacaulis sp. AC460]|uniref:hypothetical protein n=1 Tax=Asticcacaulis sp. AC460 TaxID=1282360 RepID=UPI0003C3B4BB|nr:hypothetical protein [Asticcacaulis sp. AC460]ESQ87218.1 hypothetical protein ABAC460_20830 [Asticcacaulis sp. AC460]
MTIVDNTERAGMRAIISDILVRHRDGTMTDPRGRAAVAAFVTSYAPDDYLSDDDLMDLDVYLDITLQMNKLSRVAQDPQVMGRVETIIQVALGDQEILPVIRPTN